MIVFSADNFVCRPAVKGKKAAGKRGRKRSSTAVDDKSRQGKAKKTAGKRGPKRSATGEDDKPRNRGSIKARTCSNCKRVLISVAGLQYHVGTYARRQVQCLLTFASSLIV
jgi:hypothetical protein